MSSDRERVSADLNQQYRSVVFQQGRVTLAADQNEMQDIAGEALRADVGDIVGPVGTPDNGYTISYPGKSGPTDFTVGKGTMYLGGERLELLQDITYFGQKDGEWLEFPADQDFSGHDEQVWLFAREQELGAVEDPTLLEVALGGPDTAQRTRFVQRVMRTVVRSPECPSAWLEVLADWKQRGYDFDPKQMRFLPFARLQVGLDAPPANADPCEPAPQGGYLGADNQCVRVMVTAFDPAANTAKIVWAFDNASHRFRVVLQKDKVTLKLGAPPVDAFHWPRAGQAVEVLRSAVRLADGNTMAQELGEIGELAAGYDADLRTVRLASPLGTPPFVPEAGDPPLYLQLWEQTLEVKIGQPVALGDTGLQVALSAEDNHALAPGVFWLFAVRPTTPQDVYPHRYLDAPQPPEGPRLWGCPLAILHWVREAAIVTDCRQPFDNLVELTRHKSGCCELTVGKKGTYPDLATAFADITAKNMASVGLCLLPDPPVHKLNSLIRVHREAQLRVDISGSGPLTALEIEGGGFDVQGIRAFALNKLHVRLMDERSQFLVRHCESLEVMRTRIDRITALQTVPMLDSASNRYVRIDDSTFDAGYAVFTEFVAKLGAVIPLAMPLFALELLAEPRPDIEAEKRLMPLTRLSHPDMDTLLKGAEEAMVRQGFDNSHIYAGPMKNWLTVIARAGDTDQNNLKDLAKALLTALQKIHELQLSHPGTGAVLDHVGDNWLESSEFRCAVSFSGTPGKRVSDFGKISGPFKDRLVVAANTHVTHLSRCTFDILTYGDALLEFLGQKHKSGAPFHAPTSLVVEGCLFTVSPCFFFGADVFMTNNGFTCLRGIAAAWVLSGRFLPLSNSGIEGPIEFLASNDVKKFEPLNLIGLKPA